MLSLSFLLWTGWSSYLENQENKIPGAVEADKRHSAAGSFGLQGSVPQIQISVRSSQSDSLCRWRAGGECNQNNECVHFHFNNGFV